MNKSELLESYKKDTRERWFKDHVAKVETWIAFESKDDANPKNTALSIRWARPNDSNYAVHYVILRNQGTVVVMGDIGEAVYRFSSPIDMAFLASLDTGYFAGKQVAAEKGTAHGKTWDGQIALEEVRDLFKGLISELQADNPKKAKEVKAWLKDNAWWESSCSFPEELYRALEKSPLAEDGNLAEYLSGVGIVYSIRTVGHLVGLKMIHDQLSQKPA